METVVAHVLSQKNPMEMVELRRTGSVSPDFPCIDSDPTSGLRSRKTLRLPMLPIPQRRLVWNFTMGFSWQQATICSIFPWTLIFFYDFWCVFCRAWLPYRLALVGAVMEGGSFSGRRRQNSAKFGEPGKRSEIRIWMKGELNEPELGESLGRWAWSSKDLGIHMGSMRSITRCRGERSLVHQRKIGSSVDEDTGRGLSWKNEGRKSCMKPSFVSCGLLVYWST